MVRRAASVIAVSHVAIPDGNEEGGQDATDPMDLMDPVHPATTPAPHLGGRDALAEKLLLARELIAAERLQEADELLVAVRVEVVSDPRVLKLLAAVKLKLGRLPEAHDLFRQAVAVAVDDAALRLNLGLIALKLGSYAEAVRELEAAVRMRAEDRMGWSYLGYAYAKSGHPARAATAFRRAGQVDIATHMEELAFPRPGAASAARASTPTRQDRVPSPSVDASATRASTPEQDRMQRPPADASAARASTSTRPGRRAGATPFPHPAPAYAPGNGAGDTVTTLADFTCARLLELSPARAQVTEPAPGVLRWRTEAESYLRGSAVVVVAEAAAMDAVRQRRRGQLTDEVLTDGGDRFWRTEGKAELLLFAPEPNRSPRALWLDRDVLYLQLGRVLAWGNGIVWECGMVPGHGSSFVQFRGSGLVVLAGADELVGVTVTAGRQLSVPSPRLAGWLGNLVVQARPPDGSSAPSDGAQLTCVGEGVLLISTHGKPR